MTILGYLLALTTGVILGAVGGGGSILTVPILAYVMQVEATHATSYSLFIVGVASAVGCATYVARKLVDWRMVLVFGLPAICGIFIVRKLLFSYVPPEFIIGDIRILRDQGVLLFLAVLLLISSAVALRQKEGIGKFSAQRREQNGSTPYYALTVRGLLTGCVTGFAGVGGGFLIVPALSLSTRLDFKAVIGTSLAIIAVNSLMGFGFDQLNGHVDNLDWGLLLFFTALTLAGTLVGARWSRKVSSTTLRRFFAGLLLFVGLSIILIEAFRFWH